MRQAQAFDAAARHVRHDISDEISLVYDPFVPRPFLCRLIETLAESNIRVSAWSAAREEAEAALACGAVQLALCQARNRSLGSEMAWRSVGVVELDFYAAASLFADEQPVSLFELASQPQLVMHPAPDGVAAKQDASPIVPSTPMTGRCCAYAGERRGGPFCRSICRRQLA
jgi:hypothetical protein